MQVESALGLTTMLTAGGLDSLKATPRTTFSTLRGCRLGFELGASEFLAIEFEVCVRSCLASNSPSSFWMPCRIRRRAVGSSYSRRLLLAARRLHRSGVAGVRSYYTVYMKNSSCVQVYTHTQASQRAQYPLIKEYSLNHNMKPYMI